ncbi:MAG: hypothetical protein M1828_006746 [Chrysothrix sp. TS-e1954]|nr:MAG: hypothetical protein M1828_006746 [Chrysothrix sp. TS-e1954]
MGNVASSHDAANVVYCRDQERLAVTSVRVTNSRNRTLYTILPNTFPATRYTVQREAQNDAVIEYVQDPDGSPSSPKFLLRLNDDDDIYFYFSFSISQTPSPHVSNAPSDAMPAIASLLDTAINGLTFTFASTPKDLDTLVTREFNADPNLHRHPNVDLVGDYSTAGQVREHFEWSWKWRPPKPIEDSGGGWRNACSFVEYDERSHRLKSLIAFSFWVQSTQQPLLSPKITFSKPQLAVPPLRMRDGSTKSVESKFSDSDTELRELREPPSPIGPIQEIDPFDDNPAVESTVKVGVHCQTVSSDFSASEDGPIFRATMKALESKTGSMRTRMKQVLKKAEAAKMAQVESNQSTAAFLEALQAASASNANAVRPALDHYFEKIAKLILRYEVQNAEDLQRLIIDPIARLYSNDIKQAESKKKDFEEESKDYYAYMSRYLGQRQDSLKEKKRAESDTKYQNKRKTFELKRFDYSSFMQDLHGGRKDQEVLSQLTKFADAQARGYLDTAKNIEYLLPQLEALSFEVKEADKQYQLLRTGREEKRRALETNSRANVDLDTTSAPIDAAPVQHIYQPSVTTAVTLGNDVAASKESPGTRKAERPLSRAPAFSSNITELTSTTDSDLVLSASPVTLSSMNVTPQTVAQAHKLREVDAKDHRASIKTMQHRKEGLLWSLSKPGSHADPRGLNKQAWHKYWIVLDQGKLSEYINWKQSLEQHLEPIDLRMASVREARNSERRFCFEVITPHFTRVYQATGEDDMKSWIYAINNALQSAYEGKSAPAEVTGNGKTSGSIGKDIFGKSSSFHGHRTMSSSAVPLSRNINRNATVGERPTLNRSHSSDERPAHLLQAIRAADAGNAWCADCNSDARVEWVSINLGIIVCIECSGIHRSLGTHISKIRSLTLDTKSFSSDIIEILSVVGNRMSNMIWEACLDQMQKPTFNASRDQRLTFITAKYARRAYVEPISASFSHYTSAEETLLASIKKNDIQNVLYALALGASPNATDRSRATHAMFLALAAADPAAPGSLPSLASNTGSKTDSLQTRKPFAVAELLLQNGADLPAQTAPFPLSQSALLYLEHKRVQRTGQSVNLEPQRDTPKRERLVKRNPTGSSYLGRPDRPSGNV